MLKLTVRPQPNEFNEGRLAISAGSLPVFKIGVQEWHMEFSCWTVNGIAIMEPAASRCHALELGIVGSARWIAVELLKDPVPGKGVPEGVSLWLARDEHAVFHMQQYEYLWLGQAGRATRSSGFITLLPLGEHTPPGSWFAQGERIPWRTSLCASREQALAALIGHAASWIAVALEQEKP